MPAPPTAEACVPFEYLRQEGSRGDTLGEAVEVVAMGRNHCITWAKALGHGGTDGFLIDAGVQLSVNLALPQGIKAGFVEGSHLEHTTVAGEAGIVV
jgi:hypothetical protein